MAYKKIEQGADTIFEVTPEEAPPMPMQPLIKMLKVVGYIFVFLIVAVVIQLLATPLGKISGLVGWAGSASVIWWWVKRPKSENLVTKGRSPSRFSVNSEGITLNGQFFKRNDIHRIITRNQIYDAQEGQVIFSGTHSYNAGVAMRVAWQKKLADVSHHVQFESGGVPHILAGGLTESGAYAIQADVAAIVGFK